MSLFRSKPRAEWLLWTVSELQEKHGTPCSTEDLEEATAWDERQLKPFLTELLNEGLLAGCTCGICLGDFAITASGRRKMECFPALKDSKPIGPIKKPDTNEDMDTLF
ncbi:hypothetical protein HOT82_gp144 [Gordonia phage Ronaldo]|uniref:Uncharacterized protein n=4 Tax=Ronaldovirus TaxID=2733205 RepID=A0A6B9LGM5_9CAUD|nr:hypothetical protein HOT81_gp141 [Gordonia phage Fryberger]YP_009807825.1 hypothetical protein HOT82_gp144 [Gordonia phage Ronaldo]QDH48469.1 hypothetical protein SEA_ZIKO_133 [Gordonia phage Ziko]QHB38245.1 hypothetical protein SEA_VOLT_134 [Gordonia phage Volt]AXN53542.1 hypothetical protein SEA_FRYBERGER_129 [Gordonia phage Fryberger]AXN53711.1 hypothetical protein SEA_RONALDO_131 [Gordonia phage Ronaldo]